MLYLIEPHLTGAESREAVEFVESIEDAIGDHQDCTIVKTSRQAGRVGKDVVEGDGIAVFATSDLASIDESVVTFLERASGRTDVILPIAMDPSGRGLPEPISDLAVFATYEWLVARDLPRANLASVARLYAWNLLAATQPTFANRDVRMFISYARVPSEELAKGIDAALRAHGSRAVRDNKDLHSGEPVRSAIEADLEECDVLVLLDTTEAQESEWVEWELLTAAERGIPIVWVDCGAPERNEASDYLPGAAPDISAPWPDGDLDALAAEIDRVARDKLLGAVPKAEGFVGQLDDWAREAKVDLAKVDPRQGIYELTYPDPDDRSPYPARRRRHVVQVFARRLRQSDHEALVEWLDAQGYFVKDRRVFDAAVMTSAAPLGLFEPDDNYSKAESTDRYLQMMEARDPAAVPDWTRPPGLLLFGAFPKGAATTEQIVRAAREVTTTWLRLGGEVTFGGHPTITWHVVHSAAEAVGKEASQKQVHLYQSGYWSEQPRMEEIKELASVQVVPRVPGDKDASLEKMRRRMIKDSEAVAAVAIGGRTTESGTHEPGIRAEVTMSCEAQIPTFLLGATGGETALLAAEHSTSDRPFANVNNAPVKDNQRLAITDDYSGAGVTIWRATST